MEEGGAGILQESSGCGLDHKPKQAFGQFLQNGSIGFASSISMDNLPLSRKTSFGSVELSRSNRGAPHEVDNRQRFN